MTLGDQADALGYQPSEISSIEMGHAPLPPGYAMRLTEWLRLNEQEQRELLKKIEGNVIAFPRRSTGGDKTSSMRLFRKISKMCPNEIRSFGKKSPPEATRNGSD
jgi:hypothetical protein